MVAFGVVARAALASGSLTGRASAAISLPRSDSFLSDAAVADATTPRFFGADLTTVAFCTFTIFAAAFDTLTRTAFTTRFLAGAVVLAAGFLATAGFLARAGFLATADFLIFFPTAVCFAGLSAAFALMDVVFDFWFFVVLACNANIILRLCGMRFQFRSKILMERLVPMFRRFL